MANNACCGYGIFNEYKWFQFAKTYLNVMIMVAIIFVYKGRKQGRKHRAAIETWRF